LGFKPKKKIYKKNFKKNLQKKVFILWENKILFLVILENFDFLIVRPKGLGTYGLTHGLNP